MILVYVYECVSNNYAKIVVFGINLKLFVYVVMQFS